MTRSITRTAPALAALLALAACGGGGGLDDSLSAEVAQGYAADAATMPVSATNSVDAATGALETALGTATTADAPSMQAQALAEPQATGGTSCVLGGSIAWTVTGPADTLGNGRLDAGETYTVTYTGCVTDAGTTLDGSMQLAVATRTTSAIDFTVTATGLKATTANAVYQLDGNLREQRSSVTTPVGGTQVTGAVSSSGITLLTTRGTRQATYQLRSLNWTVVRTYSSTGTLQTRTHAGSLEMTANTPRRPAASLSITTQGTLTVLADGFAGAGSFTVRTARDTIACTYGNGTAVLTLDRGNDGTINRSWTLQRTDFIDAAG